MKKRLLWHLLLVPVIMTMAACDTALTVGSRTVGISSGEFVYTDGYLRTTYPFPQEAVWAACDKALSGLKATEVEREKSIARGEFKAYIQDDKVAITVEYLERNLTAVSVRVGLMGNNLASQLVHDRIADQLKKP
jgi:hypothetical protein